MQFEKTSAIIIQATVKRQLWDMTGLSGTRTPMQQHRLQYPHSKVFSNGSPGDKWTVRQQVCSATSARFIFLHYERAIVDTAFRALMFTRISVGNAPRALAWLHSKVSSFFPQQLPRRYFFWRFIDLKYVLVGPCAQSSILDCTTYRKMLLVDWLVDFGLFVTDHNP